MAQDPGRDADADAARRGRRRLGLALIALGAAALLWAVLYMNVHALGLPPDERSFSHRRPYNQVKRSAHEAFPGFLLRAALGGALVYGGVRLRRAGR